MKEEGKGQMKHSLKKLFAFFPLPKISYMPVTVLTPASEDSLRGLKEITEYS